MKKYKPSITVGTFKDMLNAYDDDTWLDFSTLDFYRLKQRADDLVQVEFNQSVYRDEQGNVVVDNHE